jgi:hypothetical protein
VLAGSGGAQKVASATKSGFETPIRVPQGVKTFRVQAVDEHGHAIGTSKAFGVSG